MPTAISANQKLASALLKRDVVEFIAERRPERSWRVIARDIYEATKGQVDVTPQTVINWYGEREDGS
jgi:hypothetical protein